MPKMKTNSVISTEATGDVAALLESTNPPKVALPCSLSTFFPLCRLAWGYCREHIVRFANRSPRFTEAFITQQLEKVDLTETLPNVETRKAIASAAHNQLKVDAQAIKMLCQDLKTYIQYAFNSDAAQEEAALKEAGIWDYSEVGNKWKNLETMINSAKNYMRTNMNTLTDRNNMPPEFFTSFELTAAVFTTSWKVFMEKEAAIEDGTGTQEDGLREIMSELKPMLKLGRRIFIFDPVQRRKFTMNRLKFEIQGHQPAGVGGIIKVAGKNKGIASVTVSATVEGELRSVVSDEKGKYKLKLPAGTYDVRYEATGFETYILKDKQVKPGVTARPKVELQPLPEPPAGATTPSPDASVLEKAVSAIQEQAKQMPDAVVSDANGLHLKETA